MKIEKIESNGWRYDVTLVPNWFEKQLGVPTEVRRYKASSRTYTYGGGAIYICEDGGELENGNWIAVAIDKWRRKF